MPVRNIPKARGSQPKVTISDLKQMVLELRKTNTDKQPSDKGFARKRKK